MRKLTRDNYWITVAIAFILPGMLASAIEYALTKGVSGWIPVVSAAAGGSASLVAMRWLKGAPPSEPDESPGLPIESPQTYEANFGDKVFSRRTPAELVELVIGQTEVAAKHASSPHLGLWLMVEASVHDVSDGVRRDTFTVQATDFSGKPRYSLGFDADRWGLILRTLKVGDHLSAIGKIESLRTYGSIWLEECELLK